MLLKKVHFLTFLCAKQALLLPNSNADIERIFSVMNYVRSKFENSMKTDLLNAIIVIKFRLIRKGKRYMPYKLPDSAVKAIGISQNYKSSIQTCSTDKSTTSSNTTIVMGNKEGNCDWIFYEYSYLYDYST